MAKHPIHEKSLSRSGVAAAITEVLPPQPSPSDVSGVSSTARLFAVAKAATALYHSIPHRCPSKAVAAMKRDAPSLASKLAAWLPVLKARIAAIAPLRVSHVEALLTLLTGAPATGAPAVPVDAGGVSASSEGAAAAAAVGGAGSDSAATVLVVRNTASKGGAEAKPSADGSSAWVVLGSVTPGCNAAVLSPGVCCRCAA